MSSSCVGGSQPPLLSLSHRWLQAVNVVATGRRRGGDPGVILIFLPFEDQKKSRPLTSHGDNGQNSQTLSVPSTHKIEILHTKKEHGPSQCLTLPPIDSRALARPRLPSRRTWASSIARPSARGRPTASARPRGRNVPPAERQRPRVGSRPRVDCEWHRKATA